VLTKNDVAMKKLSIFLLIALFAVSCNHRNTVVCGKINNPSDELTGLFINYLDKSDTIPVNEDGTFFTEFDLNEEHLAWFGHGTHSVALYLIPGAKVNLEFDANEFEGWIYSNVRITGKNSEESEFLYTLDKNLNKPLREELSGMKVDNFAVIMKDLEQTTSDEIEKFIANHSPSKLFAERIQLKQKVELALKYLDFINYHQYSNPKNTTIPATFQEFINAIPLNDEENCKEISEYNYFLYRLNNDIVNKKLTASGLYKETSAYINKMAEEIIALNAPQAIKDDIGERHFSVFYKRPDSLRMVYRARYKDVVKNQEYVKEFEKLADARDMLKTGNIAPTFNYPDINGEMVSSESLKGKVVYVDVWATWCGPCIQEIPHLKKLQNDLKDEKIAFVSISIDAEKDKEAWRKMVEEKELGGHQLYAKGEGESKIAKDYVIRGIPYFIIIDKNGRLVEVFASRPSDPETKEKLLTLAKS